MITKTVLAAALALAACVLAASPDQNEARISRIENGLLPGVLIKGQPHRKMSLAERMVHYKVPGLSVAVINNGAIDWARGYGLLEAGGSQRVTPDTLFQAASISKPVAAMGALSLVGKGKLNLDEDVNQKLRTWKVPENEFTKEKKVTLRALLNHSAGMTVHGFRGYAAGAPLPSLLDILDGHKPANSAPIRVDVTPGTRWRYSGGGITVAQLLVMDVSGEPFPQFMKANVLEKIGMNQSTSEQPLPKDRAARASAGHDQNGEVVPGRWRTYPEMAAAGLWTTPSDLARFAIEIQSSLEGKSNKVLSKEMTAEMLKPSKGGYGLGLQVKGAGRAATFDHGGTNEGFRCQMFAYAETGQGAVVMTNGDRGALLADEILRSVAAEYGWPDYNVPEREVAKVDPKLYETFVGEYQTNNSSLTVSAEDGHLFLKGSALGADRMELFPESETTYFIISAGMTFTFGKDGTGIVSEMMVQPPKGDAIQAKRIK